MRLRRETGDFQIKITEGEEQNTYVVNTIRTGLSAEDFVGELVYLSFGADAAYTIITTAAEADGIIRLVTPASYELVYDPATGELTASFNGG